MFFPKKKKKIVKKTDGKVLHMSNILSENEFLFFFFCSNWKLKVSSSSCGIRLNVLCTPVIETFNSYMKAHENL